MKTIIVEHRLPVTIAKNKSIHDRVEIRLIERIRNQTQAYKSSIIQNLEMCVHKDTLDSQQYFYKKDKQEDVYHLGLIGNWQACCFKDATAENKKEIASNLKHENMYPIFPNMKEFNYDFLNYQTRMNNIFNFCAWDDNFKLIENDYSYDDYIKLNKLYADELSKIIKNQPECQIWIRSHLLWLVPKFLSKMEINVKIGLSHIEKFPSLEIIRGLQDTRGCLESIMMLACKYYFSIQSEDTVHGCVIYKEDRQVIVKVSPLGIVEHKMDDKQYKKHLDQYRSLLPGTNICIGADLDNNISWINGLQGIERYAIKHPNEKLTICLTGMYRNSINFQILDEVNRLIMLFQIKYPNIGIKTIICCSHEQYSALLSICKFGLFLQEQGSYNKDLFLFLENNKSNCIISKYNGFFGDEINKVNVKDANVLGRSIDEFINKNRDEEIHKKSMAHSMLRFEKFFYEEMDKIIENEPKLEFTDIINRYNQAEKALLLLDYDGTLMPIMDHPDKAVPDDELIGLLNGCIKNRKNKVILLTGRSFKQIGNWLQNEELEIFAEHGCCHRLNGVWIDNKIDEIDWIEHAFCLLKFFEERTPNSFIERKKTGLVFHFQQVDPKIIKTQLPCLKRALLKTYENHSQIEIEDGKNLLEIKSRIVTKGSVARQILKDYDGKFVLAIGDDLTDENMYRAGNGDENFISVNVGERKTLAKIKRRTIKEIRELLMQMH